MAKVNLHYVRAAIEANTSKYLSLQDTRDLLIDEGLISAMRANRDAQIFPGYASYFGTEGTAAKGSYDEPTEVCFS